MDVVIFMLDGCPVALVRRCLFVRHESMFD